MIHLTDAQIDNLIDFPQAIAALESAFRELARGAAAVQRRVRTEAQGTKLSTLGAVLPGADGADSRHRIAMPALSPSARRIATAARHKCEVTP